ncbi:MAG TPA: alkaline phosphatase [Chthoniobacterales bacterium]|nr:alkaline phosphatase [Chthoniobacterales bacterium]
MKWRNQLLALFCLVVFAAFGIFYFQHWVVQKPFGIILFVGEGLAPSRIAATRVFAGGADVSLSVDSMPHVALVTNYSKDFAAPDAAAAAAAMATGRKANNRSIGTEPGDGTVPTLLQLARRSGRATGWVSDGKITSPTADAFYGHSADPTSPLEIARQLTDIPGVDLVLGGGAQEFLPETKDGNRKDGRDLLSEIRRKGFDVARTKAELEGIPGWRRPKLFGLFARGELAYADQIEARREQPSLPDMVRRAIELLQYNRGGYLLVVDARLMRTAAEQNDSEHTLAETAELDRAVAVALRYAGEKSTIIVCGNVAVGGLHLNGAPFRSDRGIAVLGLNSAGDPWFSWASGPNGTKSYGTAKLAAQQSPSPAGVSPLPEPPQEPAAFYAPAALETVEDIVVFGAGPGTGALRGSLDNTAIFKIIRDLL